MEANTLFSTLTQPEGGSARPPTLTPATLGASLTPAQPPQLHWFGPVRRAQLAQQAYAIRDREALTQGIATLGDLVRSDLPEPYQKYAITRLGQSLGLPEEIIKPMLQTAQEERLSMTEQMQAMVDGNPQLTASTVARLFRRDPVKGFEAILKYREQQQNQQFLTELQAPRPGTLGDAVDAVPRVQGPGEPQIPGGTTVSPQATVTRETPAGSTVMTAPGQTGVPSTQPGPVTPPGRAAPPGGAVTLSEAFLEKAQGIAARLGVRLSDLLNVMAFETGGTFSPRVKNRAGSGATGLIQFTEPTARALGTSTDALAQMTAEQQLDYVEQYLTPYKGNIGSLQDLYLAVLKPSAIGQPADTVLFRQGTPEYTQNAGLDRDKKGAITVADAVARLPGGTALASQAATPQAAPPASPTALEQQIAGVRAQRRRLEALTPPTAEMANRVNRLVDNLRAEEHSLVAERDRVLTRAQTQASHGLAVQRFEAEQQQQRLQQDKQQLEITKLKRELGGEFTPEQHLNLELKVRDNVRQERVSRIFEDASTGYTSVQQGADRGDAQGDYQIINGFARLQNPDSTVMLGEARMVEEAQSLWQQFTQAPDKFFSGNRLKPEVRQKFLDASRDLMERYANRTDALLTQLYSRHARTLTVPVSELIGNPKGILAERAITTRGTGVQTPAAVTTAPPARTMPSSLTGPVEEVR